MFELVRLTAQNPGFESGTLIIALWFGTGVIVGLVLALAPVAALAIECLRREQYHL
jgi:hypothetical protein